MRLRRAALAAALACLVPALAACGGSGTQIQGGDVVPARQAKQFIDAQRSSLTLPIGVLQIHTGDAVTHLAASDTRELVAQTAPSGMAYLPITWRFDTSTTKPYAGYVGTTTSPLVELHSGSGAYRLPSPDPTQGAESFYVLVEASNDDPTLDVDYDGVRQSVDLTTGKRDTGRAKALYRLTYRKPHFHDCAVKTTWTEIAASSGTCSVTDPLLLPYVRGKWAKPGHEWYVVSLKTTLTTYTQVGATLASGGIYYPVGLPRTTYHLGKLRPVQVIQSTNNDAVCPVPRSGACNSSVALVFDARPRTGATLEVVQHYRLHLGRGWGGFDGPSVQTQPGTLVIPMSKAR